MEEQTLKLTAVIMPTDKPDVYVGYIKELSGIITQAQTEAEAFANLEIVTGRMLEYKREEALALLARQTQQPAPALKRTAPLPYELVHA